MSTCSPPRDLLLGLLAIQRGDVDQGHLVDSLAVWVRDPSRPLGQIFLEQNALPADQLVELDSLVRESYEAWLDGPRPIRILHEGIAPICQPTSPPIDPEHTTGLTPIELSNRQNPNGESGQRLAEVQAEP